MDPTLLEGLVGLFLRDQPNQNLLRSLQLLHNFFSPQRFGMDANTLFGFLKGSPMYQQAVNRLRASSTQSAEAFARDAATRGIGGGGISAIRTSLAPSSFANGLNNIDSSLFDSALRGTQNIWSQQAGLAGLGGQDQNSPLTRWMRLAKSFGSPDFSKLGGLL